jgi:hypothetical protein
VSASARAPLPRAVAFGWAAAVVGACALAPLAPHLLSALPACPLRDATGWPCPGCGSGRSLAALAGLDLLAALRWNPLVAVAALGFGGLGLAAAAAELAARPLAEPRALARATRWSLAAALAGNWLYLFASGR